MTVDIVSRVVGIRRGDDIYLIVALTGDDMAVVPEGDIDTAQTLLVSTQIEVGIDGLTKRPHNLSIVVVDKVADFAHQILAVQKTREGKNEKRTQNKGCTERRGEYMSEMREAGAVSGKQEEGKGRRRDGVVVYIDLREHWWEYEGKKGKREQERTGGMAEKGKENDERRRRNFKRS